MTLTTALANWIDDCSLATLSPDTVTNAKMHILDGIGVGLDASTLAPLFDPMIGIVQRWGGDGPASVYGKPFGLPARYAAFANSIMMISSAYQETHRASVGHPYSPILTTALAISEERGANGADFIAAIVAGYEVFVRMATAMNPSTLHRGIQTTGAFAPFGAAAVAAKLMHLDGDQIRHAINHAGNFGGAALIEAHGATPYYAVHLGPNTMKGIYAAELAAAGVPGSDTILEGGGTSAKGFLQAYSDEYDTEIIRNGLGSRLGIEDTGFSFHCVASYSRTTIDALLWLMREHRLDADNIQRIEVRLTEALYNFVNDRGQFSGKGDRQAHYFIPLHMALTVVHGWVDSAMLTDETFNDPLIKSLVARVTVAADPELDADFAANKAVTAAIVEVTTTDGRIVQRRQDVWHGDPADPASPTEIEEKFRRIAGRVIGAEAAKEAIRLVSGLETLDDVRPLARLIRMEA
jgi:2-methylcitrate dehydratase PrpD